ncbi:MAG TPA: hypothetical protein VFA77_02995 [Candidatus Eisenbacteria bacterium]|nr:hypothetical protein [Candidatus Eisenbacteria bacterium]
MKKTTPSKSGAAAHALQNLAECQASGPRAAFWSAVAAAPLFHLFNLKCHEQIN